MFMPEIKPIIGNVSADKKCVYELAKEFAENGIKFAHHNVSVYLSPDSSPDELFLTRLFPGNEQGGNFWC